MKIRLDTWDFHPSFNKDNLERLQAYLQAKGYPPLALAEGGKDLSPEAEVFLKQPHLFDPHELIQKNIPFRCEAFSSSDSRLLYEILQESRSRGSRIVEKVPVNIHIEQSQDAFLHSVTEVSVHEDLCTDELQRLLGEGWRIIAVCYQKGNRRPDYVLGTTEALKNRAQGN